MANEVSKFNLVMQEMTNGFSIELMRAARNGDANAHAVISAYHAAYTDPHITRNRDELVRTFDVYKAGRIANAK